MKNILLIFFFCIGTWATAQEESNPFSKAESSSSEQLERSQNTGSSAANLNPGGPPGDENEDEKLPIDDYLPFLVLTAVGIIIYQKQKKRNLLS